LSSPININCSYDFTLQFYPAGQSQA